MTSDAPHPAGAPGPLGRDAEIEVMRFFAERFARPVSLDVWTRRDSGLVLPDRDPCEHCDDQLALMRQLVRLSPLLSITPYDLERHASRAAEVGVDMAPTTIIRSGGRSVRFVGMAGGTLFPAFLEVMSYLSIGTTPLDDASREVLAALAAPVRLELLAAPYDPYSAHLMRLAAALAAECRFVRLRVVDATEYPMFASLRGVNAVPVLSIDGQRFTGVWDEGELVEQVRRVAGGNLDPVVRSQAHAAPFITEADARRLEAGPMEAGSAAGAARSLPAPPAPLTPPAGGLYIPGRD